jgi:hypothetical protein
MQYSFPALLLGLALSISGSVMAGDAMADEKPPANAKPLSEIVVQIEGAGYGPIVEVSVNSGLWEVEAYEADVKYELHVDPVSAEIKSKRVDD